MEKWVWIKKWYLDIRDGFSKNKIENLSSILSVIFGKTDKNFDLKEGRAVTGDKFQETLKTIRDSIFNEKIQENIDLTSYESIEEYILDEEDEFKTEEAVWNHVIKNKIFSILKEINTSFENSKRSDFYIIRKSDDALSKNYEWLLDLNKDVLSSEIEVLKLPFIDEDKVIIMHKNSLKILVDVAHSTTWAEIYSKPPSTMIFNSDTSLAILFTEELPCRVLQLDLEQKK